MATVIPLFKEGKLYVLDSIENGSFFDFHNKLLIKLKNKKSTIVCWSPSDNRFYNINPLNKVYKCSDIEIKYSLEQIE